MRVLGKRKHAKAKVLLLRLQERGNERDLQENMLLRERLFVSDLRKRGYKESGWQQDVYCRLKIPKVAE